MAANAGNNVCLRRVEAKAILDSIRAHRVTHYCGAPIMHGMLINAPDEWKTGIDHAVSCLVAAAALLTDYILTVAVSISSGIAAITSAYPQLLGHTVLLCVASISASVQIGRDCTVAG